VLLAEGGAGVVEVGGFAGGVLVGDPDGRCEGSLRLIAGFFQPQLLLLEGFESFPELVERA
jgi:hypothetical protein